MTTTHESYPLSADSTDERKSWIQALRKVMFGALGGGGFMKFNPYANGGDFGQYKMLQKKLKETTETLEHGYSSESTQRELSNE